jgi:uncharacterized protein YxeA
MKERGIIALFLIIALLIVAILGAFYLYKFHYLEPQNFVIQKTNLNLP